MTEAPVLVINAGSSSLKYQLLDAENGEALAKGLVERIGMPGANIRHEAGEVEIRREADVPDHAAAIQLMRQLAAEAGLDLEHTPLRAVGHRVVHGGRSFMRPTVVDDHVLAEVERVSVLAPLHNPAALQGLRAALDAFPQTPHVAVFDTAFFAELPAASATYALDTAIAKKHAIRRYGFHGTSHEYVSAAAAGFLDQPDAKLIVLHLGNGASVSAVDAGRPVETSMGMTPLEGLVMGTRTGDIDPGVVLHLHRVAGLSVDEIDTLLNKKSGLLGLAGTNDMRDLVAAVEAGDDAAKLAFDVYIHRLVSYVGAYAAQLGGVDAIIFTAGVGENASAVRAALAAKLEPLLGTNLDETLNEQRSAQTREISTPDARTKLLVVPTNEEWQIARHAVDVT
ncbi:acetate kinase [Yimella sp. cx-51]|uniref:acetate kinase n=1 Tax=Yimella sp. cx-51 TaxID=2770551 RepID=UPI00165E5AB1|nr:acetate kinase [Yimella sp. cx-51]MBC9956594.1 acetate kinase [Yimella sp. cx-51]QTH38307.1 acetate kinase [Yimella sp. cx-51]